MKLPNIAFGKRGKTHRGSSTLERFLKTTDNSKKGRRRASGGEGICRPFLTSLVLLGMSGMASTQAEQSDACSRAMKLLSTATELRGLQADGKLTCISSNPSEFKKLSEEVVRSDAERLSLGSQRELLVFLGFIGSEYPYEECIINEYARRAMAFYSAKLKAVVLPDWFELPDAIVIHELVHFLQDLRFDTLEMGTARYLFDDRNLAAALILEGDAMDIEKRFLEKTGQEEMDLTHHQLDPSSPRCELPAPLSRLASSIYDYGHYYVEAVRKRGGDIDKMLRERPQTTSELLYPNRVEHAAREPELPIAESAITVGELGIRMALKEVLPLGTAITAARGWRGDEVTISRKPGTSTIVWRTVWRSIEDARAFYSAWLAVWSKRIGWTLDPKSSFVSAANSGHDVSFVMNGKTVTTTYHRRTR